MQLHKLAHLKISSGGRDLLVDQVKRWIAGGKCHTCIPLNISKYVMARGDAKLAGAINGADMVIADGIPISWLAHRIGWSDVERVTGVELAEQLLSQAKTNGWRLYFLGASPENLRTALSNIKQQYDNPIIAGARDGFFQDADVPDLIADINAARPDILFLGLGLPQKEYFIADHFSEIDVRFCITVGGAIDIWAGAKKRAPVFVQKAGLEWLYRSVYDLSRAGLILRYGLSFMKDMIIPPGRD